MPTKKAQTTKKSTKPSVTKKSTKSTRTNKSVIKKTTVKKTTSPTPAAKKSSKKTTQKRSGRVLVCADGASCFWTTDGQILQDLIQLSEALEQMADEVFMHHVTKDKNDFADWVESVLEDAECAAALRRSKKPNTARTVVVRHLREYTI